MVESSLIQTEAIRNATYYPDDREWGTDTGIF